MNGAKSPPTLLSYEMVKQLHHRNEQTQRKMRLHRHSESYWPTCWQPFSSAMCSCRTFVAFKQKPKNLKDLGTWDLCLSETWLTKSLHVASFTMPCYNVFRKDRNKWKGDGLLMYVKDKCMERIALTFTTIVSCLPHLTLCQIRGDSNLNWAEKNTGKKLKALTNQFKMTQLIYGPTRITNR